MPNTTRAAVDGWRRSMSEPPVGGGAGVGNVGAVGPGPDGVLEVFAEGAVMLCDACDVLADGSGRGEVMLLCPVNYALAAGKPPGPEGSLGKLVASHLARAAARVYIPEP